MVNLSEIRYLILKTVSGLVAVTLFSASKFIEGLIMTIRFDETDGRY
jgi:hypothetical protein